jgi:hypothetical protein
MPPPAVLAGRREWTGLALIGLPCMVCAMDVTVLNLALRVTAALGALILLVAGVLAARILRPPRAARVGPVESKCRV